MGVTKITILLKVTPETLKNKASETEATIKSLENVFNNIQDIISRTSGYWVGIAGDKARSEFNSQKDEMQKVLQRFKEHPTDLMVMAGVYEEAERSVLSQNQSLAVDVIV